VGRDSCNVPLDGWVGGNTAVSLPWNEPLKGTYFAAAAGLGSATVKKIAATIGRQMLVFIIVLIFAFLAGKSPDYDASSGLGRAGSRAEGVPESNIAMWSPLLVRN
jgi:hypothetical protein